MKPVARNSDRQGAIEVCLRDTVDAEDVVAVRSLVASTTMFADHEIDVAVELVSERISRGPASGYHFLFAESGRRLIGYACYGPIACTSGSFDLYWIAVSPELQGRGIGRLLLGEVEQRLAHAHGRQLYIETSSRAVYQPTRRFYERCGYVEVARLEHFYAPGDAKVIYRRILHTTPQ